MLHQHLMQPHKHKHLQCLWAPGNSVIITQRAKQILSSALRKWFVGKGWKEITKPLLEVLSGKQQTVSLNLQLFLSAVFDWTAHLTQIYSAASDLCFIQTCLPAVRVFFPTAITDCRWEACYFYMLKGLFQCFCVYVWIEIFQDWLPC